MTQCEHDHDDDSGDFDDDDIDRFDCGLDAESGQCSLAGTEDCDWECPNRNSKYFAGSAAFCRAHKQLYYTEVHLARHALGLVGDKKRSYRNYYTVGEHADEYKEWMNIVAKGLAVRIDRRGIMGGDWLFHLTRAGAEQALYEGESLDPEDFSNFAEKVKQAPNAGRWCFRCRAEVPITCLVQECPYMKDESELAAREGKT